MSDWIDNFSFSGKNNDRCKVDVLFELSPVDERLNFK